MKCEICGRDRQETEGTVIKLTDEEREFILLSTGSPAPLQYFYCAPCYRIVTDREQGARLISGQMEMQLRSAGHPHAHQIAERIYNFLIEKSKAKRVS
jgi:hypothetical protein